MKSPDSESSSFDPDEVEKFVSSNLRKIAAKNKARSPQAKRQEHARENREMLRTWNKNLEQAEIIPAGYSERKRWLPPGEIAQIAAVLQARGKERRKAILEAIGLYCETARIIAEAECHLTRYAEGGFTLDEALCYTGLKERAFRRHYEALLREVKAQPPDWSDDEIRCAPVFRRDLCHYVKKAVNAGKIARGRKGYETLKERLDSERKKYTAVNQE